MNRTTVIARVVALALGICAGYGLSPWSSLTAQRSKPSYDPQVGQAPLWETPIPAPPLPQGQRTMWPNQPNHATYWSVRDIREAHRKLAEQELAGKAGDPGTALHDFPYWTRTQSMFIYHATQKPMADSAQEHLGYAQFVVVIGGSGTLMAGGRIANAHTLTESGRQIPGELRGETIEQGNSYTVAEGDMVSIPPNTPAQFKASSREGMSYMVMKVNAMLYPWDLIR